MRLHCEWLPILSPYQLLSSSAKIRATSDQNLVSWGWKLSINTNWNPPPQTYCQLPTKICYHRAPSLESAVNEHSVEGHCTDPASICFPQIRAVLCFGPSCAFVFIEVIRLSSIAPSSYRPNIKRRWMVGQAAIHTPSVLPTMESWVRRIIAH